MADSKRITFDSITKQSFWNLFNLINNRSNVPNPINSSNKFVYTRIPDIGRGFNNFPFIVISRSRPTKNGHTADLSKAFRNYSFSIMVYTQDNNSDSSGDPKGAAQNELITDSIIKTLDNPTNRKTLIDYGMANLVYDTDTDEDEFEGKSVFVTEFDLRFNNNLIATS